MNDAHLDEFLTAMQQINHTAEQLVTGLTEEQLNWIPEPGAWSIALCLAHLTITNQEFLPHLDRAMAKARQRGASTRPYKPTLLGGWLIRSLKQAGGRKFKAPKNFQPPPQPAPGALIRFLEEQRRIATLMERSKGTDINVMMRSPVTALMRYSLGDAFASIVAHAQRHLRQAQRVKERPDFPRSEH